MAEENIKYNIEIDREQLAQELEEVRNQIDLSMGALADRAVESPQASNLISLSGGEGVAPLPESPMSDPSGFSNMMEQGFWSNFAGNISNGANNMAQGFDQAAGTISIGAQKFQGDMRRLGLLSQPDYPEFGPRYSEGQMPHREGFFGGTFGTLAPSISGYDPNTLGLNIADYREESARSAGESFANFAANWGMAGAGAAAGLAIGGFAGAATGFTIGGLADLTGNIFAGEALEKQSLAKGLNSIAKSNFGGLSSEQGNRMASIIQNKAYDPISKGLNYDIDTIQEDVSSFAEAGGFSSTTNAQEMEQVLEKVVEQTRHFANTLKLKKDEATQIMAQLSSSMSMEGGDFIDMASKLSYGSSVTGMHPGNLASFGIQSSEMFRGTGITPDQSFDMAIDARIQAERLKQQDPITRQLVQDAGGANQFALKQMDQANTYMSSGQGLMVTAGMLGGMESYDSINTMGSSAANFMNSDPQNYFRLIASQGEISGGISLEDKQGLMVSSAVNVAKGLGFENEEGIVDQKTLEGLMPQLGITGSPQEARALIEAARDNASRDPAASKLGAMLSERQDIIRANQTTLVGELKTDFFKRIKPLSDFFQPARDVIGDAYVGGMNSIVETGEDVADWFNNTERIRTDDILSSGRAADEVDRMLKEDPSSFTDRYNELRENFSIGDNDVEESKQALVRELTSPRRGELHTNEEGEEVLNQRKASMGVGLTGGRRQDYIDYIRYKGEDTVSDLEKLSSIAGKDIEVSEDVQDVISKNISTKELNNYKEDMRLGAVMDQARKAFGVDDLTDEQAQAISNYMDSVEEVQGGDFFGEGREVVRNIGEEDKEDKEEHIQRMSDEISKSRRRGSSRNIDVGLDWSEKMSNGENLIELQSQKVRELDKRKAALGSGLTGGRKDDFIEFINYKGIGTVENLEKLSSIAGKDIEVSEDVQDVISKNISTKELNNYKEDMRLGAVMDQARKAFGVDDLTDEQAQAISNYMDSVEEVQGGDFFGEGREVVRNIEISKSQEKNVVSDAKLEESLEKTLEEKKELLGEDIVLTHVNLGNRSVEELDDKSLNKIQEAILSEDYSGLSKEQGHIAESFKGSDIVNQITQAEVDLSTVQIKGKARQLANSMGIEEGDFENMSESQKQYFYNQVAKGAASGEDITVADSIGMDQDQLEEMLSNRGLNTDQIMDSVEKIRQGNMTGLKKSLRSNIGDIGARKALSELQGAGDLIDAGMIVQRTSEEVLNRMDMALMDTPSGPAFRTRASFKGDPE